MKQSFPQVAIRRGFGGLSDLFTSSVNPAQSPRAIRSISAAPRSQHPLRCSRRHISDATASLKPKPHNQDERTWSDGNYKKSGSSPSTHTSSASSISEHVRLLMRQVPYPVAIITATDPSGPSDTTSFRGMTVSSFNTVTLTPHPVISFNVRRPSETLNALLASGRFLVHLLAPGPITATLARDFSKGNVTLASMLDGHGDFEFGALDVCPDSQASNEGSNRPLPILRRKETGSADKRALVDFPFVFECVLHPHKLDVHDHSIVLGTVVRAIEHSNGSPAEQKSSGKSDELCLTYANTRFWKMGERV
ncbi:FMN-binding split barrel-like protein [Penicillium capsulatum]|uniref:FMN-binding split barrel-like protein n=1 Tax=Penicillium capsulatum TaxID=69766 RepID=A0A9W9LQ91_9EURO|nr:FMN-binding split barrel-like protein [Penicillium capsulatum]KAJ6136222.1 FMN-binding split barrel-like protein [Penicillium capsulatum]